MEIDYMQLEFLNEKLRDLMKWVEGEMEKPVITSLYRIGDSGVHGQLPVRGCDLRCRDEKYGKIIEGMVNEKWAYDPNRPEMKCCILHGKGSNMHLHLQVHPNTVLN